MHHICSALLTAECVGEKAVWNLIKLCCKFILKRCGPLMHQQRKYQVKNAISAFIMALHDSCVLQYNGKIYFFPKKCSFCPYKYFCTFWNHCSWVILSSSIMILKFSSCFTVVLHPRSLCWQKTGIGFNGSFAESVRTAEIIRSQLLKVTVYRSLYVH